MSDAPLTPFGLDGYTGHRGCAIGFTDLFIESLIQYPDNSVNASCYGHGVVNNGDLDYFSSRRTGVGTGNNGSDGYHAFINGDQYEGSNGFVHAARIVAAGEETIAARTVFCSDPWGGSATFTNLTYYNTAGTAVQLKASDLTKGSNSKGCWNVGGIIDYNGPSQFGGSSQSRV